jgi:hypothetical protein
VWKSEKLRKLKEHPEEVKFIFVEWKKIQNCFWSRIFVCTVWKAKSLPSRRFWLSFVLDSQQLRWVPLKFVIKSWKSKIKIKTQFLLYNCDMCQTDTRKSSLPLPHSTVFNFSQHLTTLQQHSRFLSLHKWNSSLHFFLSSLYSFNSLFKRSVKTLPLLDYNEIFEAQYFFLNIFF